jgi:hypothetical protein
VKPGQKIGLDLRLKFVLAGLAGEHDHDGVTPIFDDRIKNSLGHFYLILSQAETVSLLGKRSDVA